MIASRSSVSFVAVAAMLLIATTGCPKPTPPPQPPEPTPSVVEAPVAIDALVPNRTNQGRAVTVTVEGRGFEDGMDVFVGKTSPLGLDVQSESEFTFRASEDMAAGTYDIRIVRADGEQALKRDAFTVAVSGDADGDCSLVTVPFDFNESSLSSQARKLLGENARCIEKRGFKRVRIEGHADERGSTIYNLSLGQRRAESVRSYLLNVGVGGADLLTLSYGEERPAVSGSGESAWAKNRRVEFSLP